MSDMVPLYGFGGGGGTGAALTVTAPAGCAVTVSKDGKTKAKIAGADGVAVFEGLATGEWTVTITDGVQTSAPQTVIIKADYSTAISFFAATINVAYPAGSVCTASDGVTTLTAPDTSGTWACVVHNVGTWTVTVVDKDWSDSVSIASDGQTESVDLSKCYLFLDGNQYTIMTGGWEASPDEDGIIGGTLTFSNGEIVLTGTNAGHRIDASCKSMNSGILARFTKLGVRVTYASGSSIAARIVNNLTNKKTIGQVPISGAGNYSLSLDGISEGQIILLAYNGTLKVSEVWLE